MTLTTYNDNFFSLHFTEINTCDTGGSHLSQVFWEHENLSGLSIVWLIITNLHVSWSCMILAENLG